MKFTETQIKDIAEEINMGMVCYIHKKTKEFVFLPTQEMIEEAGSAEAFEPDYSKTRNSPHAYDVIEQMPSNRAFRVMEAFVQIDGLKRKVSKRLREALQRPRPFQQFNEALREFGIERQAWFKFKDEANEQWVRKELNRLK